jgi:hypothetical protein
MKIFTLFLGIQATLGDLLLSAINNPEHINRYNSKFKFMLHEFKDYEFIQILKQINIHLTIIR